MFTREQTLHSKTCLFVNFLQIYQLFKFSISLPVSFESSQKHGSTLWKPVLLNFRSITPEVFLRKGILKICNKFMGEHPRRGVISIKLFQNFIEITLWQGCSPVNLLHVFKTSWRAYGGPLTVLVSIKSKQLCQNYIVYSS